jgi:hypothetical protein
LGPVKIDVSLLTREIEFLQRIADFNEISLSRAFEMVIAGRAETDAPPNRASFKTRQTVHIDPRTLALLDRAAMKWGLTRSDAARRLVDAALRSEVSAPASSSIPAA